MHVIDFMSNLCFFPPLFLTSLFLIKTVFKHNWKFQWKCFLVTYTGILQSFSLFKQAHVHLPPLLSMMPASQNPNNSRWIQTSVLLFFFPLHSDICHNMEEKLCCCLFHHDFQCSLFQLKMLVLINLNLVICSTFNHFWFWLRWPCWNMMLSNS